MSALERHCHWLLRAYPAWYRRERSGEMLGTLLEASPPNRRWPSFRDTRALITGGFRVRGWVWLLSMLLVGAGAVEVGYTFYLTTTPWTGYKGSLFPTDNWTPLMIVLALAFIILFTALISVPVAGLIRLRGWRRDRWLRAAAWAGTWIASVALLAESNAWGNYPEQFCPNSYQNGMVCPVPSPAVVSWGELPICAAFLVLGSLMTWILAVPPARHSDVPSTSRQPIVKAG